MKRLKVLLASLLMTAVVLTTGNPAAAASTEEMTGSISVDMKAGGDLVLYKVADVETGSNGLKQYTLTSAFAGVAGAQDQINTSAGLNDDNLPGKFASVLSGAASVATLKAANDEALTFEGLTPGVYLVTQNTAADGYYKMDPFLVTVPGENETMAVKATPKMALKGIPETTPPPSTPSKPPRIPQTGQLWWPVPVMCLCGLFFIVTGIIIRRRSMND